MGNGAFRYCIPEDKKDFDVGSLNLKSKSGNRMAMRKYPDIMTSGDSKEEENIRNLAMATIQSTVKAFLSNKKLKLLKEVRKRFENEFLPTICKDESLRNPGYVEVEVSSRKLKLQNQGVNVEERKNITDSVDNYSLLEIKYPPVILTEENNDIYDGFWKLHRSPDDNNNTQPFFIRFGYGVTYQVDGTRIDGLWNDKIITEGRIYYPDGRVYEGEIISDISKSPFIINNNVVNYLPHGKGKLSIIANESTKSNGRRLKNRNKITYAVWVKGEIHGECTESYPGKFIMKTDIVNGQNEASRAHFTYEDGTVYEGEYDSKFRKHGYGIVGFANGDIYEGYWKKDKFHGPGMMFTPKSKENAATQKKLISLFNNKSPSLELFKWGTGKYIKGVWFQGQLNGEGTIAENEKTTNCFWRFGKLIQSMVQLKNKSPCLHPNIFSFLTPRDIPALFQLKNRSIMFHFLNNNFSNLIKLRLGQMMDCDFNNYHPKSGYHNRYMCKFLLDNSERIKNLEDVLLNHQEGGDNFIPIVAYKTNGGIVEKRFHYSNLFNPKETASYISNYLANKKTDIFIEGVVAHWSNKSNKSGKDQSGNSSGENLKKSLLNFKLKNTREENESDNIQKLSTNAKDFISFYDSLFTDYKIDFYQLSVLDKNVADNISGVTNANHQHLFSLHQILLFIPMKLSLYTFLLNPVRTLAVYIHNQDNFTNLNFKDDTLIDFNSLQNINLNTLEEDIDNSSSKLKLPTIIRTVNNDDKFVVEFDTQQQNQEKKQLLALIQIKNYTNNSYHLISLKKYYHIGRYITVHLVDQTNLYGKPTSIEITSALFFGQTYHMTKT